MRKGFTKTGFICLGLILALALCGIGYAHWSDTLIIEGTVGTGEWDSGGTIGFWKNWDKHNTFTQEEIEGNEGKEGWLEAINATSDWLGPTTVEGMEDMLWRKCKSDMECKFLKQYLATRLNVESGLLSLTAIHDVTSIDKTNYLELAEAESATLSKIIAAIESKYPDIPDDPAAWPEKADYEIMKDICDTLNNTGDTYPHLSL